MKRLCLLVLLLAPAITAVPAAQGPRLVVLNKEDATLITVDSASGRILGTVPTGEGPTRSQCRTMAGPRSSATTAARAPTSRSTARTTLVIDLKTLAVSGPIETGKGPDGMAWVK